MSQKNYFTTEKILRPESHLTDKKKMMELIRIMEARIIDAINECDWSLLPHHVDIDVANCWFTMLKEKDKEVDKFIERCKSQADMCESSVYLTRETETVKCDVVTRNMENCIYLVLNNHDGPLIGIELRINAFPLQTVSLKTKSTLINLKNQ